MKEVSYIKTQWFRLFVAFFCLVMTGIYAFRPSPEVLTVETLAEVTSNMLTAGFYLSGFITWALISVINYNQDRIKLLEKKVEKYDALCETVNTLVEVNRADKERLELLEQQIAQLKRNK